MKIGIICCHGNGDPGACNAKYGTEADFVRRLAPIIYRYLSSFASVEILDSSINWYVYLQSIIMISDALIMSLNYMPMQVSMILMEMIQVLELKFG